MAHLGVHMYPYNQEASLGNFNMPVSNSQITLYKGANTPLSFTIHNADGKYMIIGDNDHLTFSIYEVRTNKIIFETTLIKQIPTWVSESSQARPTFNNKVKIYYGCIVPMGVIQDFSIGSKYRWSIKKTTLDGALVENSQYLYTGLNYEGSAELVISTAASPVFVGSTEISEDKNGSWIDEKMHYYPPLPIECGVPYEHAVLKTSAIRADAQVGLVDGLSTIAFYLKDFIGRYQLQGYLGNDSPDDAEDYKWFIIKLNGKEFIENDFDIENNPIALNGINAYNFKGNFMWIRVVCLIPPVIEHLDPVVTVKRYPVFNVIPKILIRR